MNLTVNTIAKSLANYLEPFFPDVNFYEDPNQQGTKTPCMFLQQRFSSIDLQTGGRWLKHISLDLTYLVDFNLPNMQKIYQTAGEMLDMVMETFLYKDDTSTDTVLIRTYERQWNVDLDALHYKFEIKELVSIPKEYPKMNTIQDLNEEVKTYVKE